MADDDELGTMIGRFRRADEVNGALHAYDRARTPPTRSSPRASRRAFRPTIVGNGAELPRFDQLAARDVFVRQPGESWIRPARAVPLPRRRRPRADRARPSAPARVVGAAASARRRDRRRAGRSAARRCAGARLHRVLGRARSRPRGCRRWAPTSIKVEAVQRPDGIRFSAAVRPHDDPQFYEKSALFHACNLGKRGITLDLGHPDGLALAKRLVARSDVVAENFTPQVLEQFGLDYDDRARAATRRAIDAAHARVRARRAVARPAAASRRRWSSSPAWRGSPATRAGRRSSPAVRSTRWSARTPRSRSSPRSSTATRTGDGQLVEVPLVEVATAVTAEQVIRYAIDGTLLGRRGAGGVYRVRGRRRVGRGRSRRAIR